MAVQREKSPSSRGNSPDIEITGRGSDDEHEARRISAFSRATGRGIFPSHHPERIVRGSPETGPIEAGIFEVRDDGVYAGGIHLLWDDITGIALDDSRCRLVSDKYRSGGIEFLIGSCELRTPAGGITRIGGFQVEYCLMNRVTFEKQRIERDFEREIDRL